MKRRIDFGYRFTIDALTLFVFIYYLNAHADLTPPVWQFLIVFIAAVFGYVVNKGIMGEQLTLFHLFMQGLLILLLGYTLGMLMFHAAIIAVFLTWRFIVYHYRPDTNHEKGMVFVSVLLGFFLYLPAVYESNPYAHQGLYIVIAQLIVLLSGKMLSSMVSVEDGFFNQWHRKVGHIVGIVGAVLGTSVALFLMAPIFIKSFHTAFNWVTYQLGLGISPIINWFDQQIDESAEPEPVERENVQSEESVMEEVNNENNFADVVSAETLLMIIVGVFVVALFVFYFIYRKRMVRIGSREKESQQPDHIARQRVKNSTFVVSKKVKPPKNEVRKAFYELEYWAAKRKIGRYADETVNQWLRRIELDASSYQDVIDVYQHVRYGESTFSENQRETYFAQLRQLKQDLKKKLT